MRRKPAHCSKVLSPRRGTLSRSLRRLNGPLSSRWRTMFSATVADSPDTRVSSAAEAVLTSTPTALTQSSTRASSARARRYWSTSCWYWPTPIALGSILTSSASGSCRRRAMDTAPRMDTSRSGNSLAANSEAEYTDAPASLTTTFCSRVSPSALMTSPASLSVSRLAVPLPIAISSTLCFWHSWRRVCNDWSHCRRGSCG
ncbi:hypothetical protein D3C71_1303860 [compost metagenome]